MMVDRLTTGVGLLLSWGWCLVVFLVLADAVLPGSPLGIIALLGGGSGPVSPDIQECARPLGC